MSIRAAIFRSAIRHHFNINPETNDHVEATFRLLEKMNKGKAPRGYVLERYTTAKGTRFERIYRRDSQFNGKVVLYLHGGGYVAGLVDTYRKLARELDRACDGAEVYLLDYDCAPEHVYPSQLEQALDMWQQLTEELHYQASNIIVGGDSAGGNLTLALLLRLRDAGRAMPRAAFCFSPWADMLSAGQSYVANYRVDVMYGNKQQDLTEDKREKLLKSPIYMFALDADRSCPYVSPVYGDYHDFPPMYFSVGGDELLLSDTLTIADNLRANGVPVDVDVAPKMFHVFPLFYSFLPESKKALVKALAFVSAQMRG